MAGLPLHEFVKFGKKIIGAGINYRSLIGARNLPLPKEPIIFLKCSTSYITEGQYILVPPSFGIHQEVELGVIIGKRGKNIKENEAFDYVGGYCLALDMTEARIMEKSQKEGLPWCIGKAFDTACPVSRFINKNELLNPEDVRIFSKVNDKVQQDSSTSDLFFKIPQLITFISQYMTLEPGDLILTGSPAGAGPVKPGDVIECGIGIKPSQEQRNDDDYDIQRQALNIKLNRQSSPKTFKKIPKCFSNFFCYFRKKNFFK